MYAFTKKLYKSIVIPEPNSLIIFLVLSAPNLLLIVLLMIVIPESPRWLITKNKKKQLVKVLEKAAKVNKQYLPIDSILESDAEEEKLASAEKLNNATVLDLFWPPTILIRYQPDTTYI